MKKLNFGRNITLRPRSFYTPKSEREVIEILERHKGERIRCVGRLHSWSRVLQCNDVLLDLRCLDGVQLDCCGDPMTARVGAGCQIKHLLDALQKRSLTLPSVGFITEQTIAGAISTGTHGSGRHSLSHYVTRVRVARYCSETGKAMIDEISSGDDLLAARCSLGCLGIILSVTIQCRANYLVEEHFGQYDDLNAVLDAEADFPLQQFFLVPWRWTYFAQHRREIDTPKSRTLPIYKWYRFLVFDIAMHLLILFSVRCIRLKSATKLLFRWVVPAFVVRNWHVVGDSSEQLVMEHELFRHVEIELFVPRHRLGAALEFLRHSLGAAENGGIELDSNFHAQLENAGCESDLSELRGSYCHHYPICIRRILPDETLISMASGAQALPDDGMTGTDIGQLNEPWYSITLTNYHQGANRKAFEELSAFLAKSMARLFGARPHWGKLCPLPPVELANLYPAFDRFSNICRNHDPDAAFTNDWIRGLLKTNGKMVGAE